MFTSLAITALVACSAFVARADPNPNSPGPGDVYNEGAQCPIAWDADTTGVWKVMNIELMTGSNLNMIHLTTVATVDGTDAAADTFSWTCPQVAPNSAIYFYQFTSPASNTTMWTTRFAIADATGKTTPPTQATQPGGQAIAWGTGALLNPADAKPPPTGASISSAAATTSVAAISSVSSSVSSSSLSASVSTIASSSTPTTGSTSSSNRGSATGSTTGTGTGTDTGTSASPSTTSAAMATLAVNNLIFQTILALGVAAAGFTALL